ncbi:phage tail sheath subtilisin-like domain-containing protein [Lysobacter sp. CA196]|uniref:phage tail sheath subtilisin-like domain-containing protein n=1 Tax=Lysobacter sp. CA196 TaxID=3455606 RepID=UPI003F8D0632
MAANFLHGVETIEIERGPRPVRQIKSAVIGLVGTAPAGPVGALTLTLNERDAAQFGAQWPGFTIPQALDAVYDHGVGTVLVVNVLDPTIHKSSIVAEAKRFDARDRLSTAHPALITVAVKSKNGQTTYAAGVDYTVDRASGAITRIKNGTIAAGADVAIDYEFADPARVTAADIIGAVNAAGLRTGLLALKDAYQTFGFSPKILIAPAYGTQASVATELDGLARQLEAVAYVDAPIGTTFEQAIAGRGPNGTINFNTASDRLRLCYPHVKVYDPATNTERLEPMSQRAAGLRAWVDQEFGFWRSSSNQPLAGVIGLERPLSALLSDPQSEVNLLNEVGITTVFNSFGTGFLLWGNRTAAFPTVTHLRNFENVRRTGDLINESLRLAAQQFIDMPITQALIDSLTESANGYGRKLIGDGALLGFQCWFDPARNPDTELAAGHLLLSYRYTPPPPMERLTYETEITGEFLANFKGS